MNEGVIFSPIYIYSTTCDMWVEACAMFSWLRFDSQVHGCQPRHLNNPLNGNLSTRAASLLTRQPPQCPHPVSLHVCERKVVDERKEKKQCKKLDGNVGLGMFFSAVTKTFGEAFFSLCFKKPRSDSDSLLMSYLILKRFGPNSTSEAVSTHSRSFRHLSTSCVKLCHFHRLY